MGVNNLLDDRHMLAQTDWNDMREVQNEIHEWANRTFPDRIPEASLTKLVMEEIPELLQHRKEKGLEDIGTELADCFILLMDLATIWGVDLPKAIHQKMRKNCRRTWRHDPNTGFYNHEAADGHDS